MSESVQILISADDQASKEMAQAALNIEQSTRKVEAVLKSLETPTDKYNKELAELTKLQQSGALSSADFGRAQAALEAKLKGTGNAFKEMGGRAKATTEFVGILANLTGSSQIGQYAGQLAQITEKAGAFSEVAKGGGAGALAFKGGLVALVATLSVSVGQALGDAIFKTSKLKREIEAATQASADFNNELGKAGRKSFELERRDIELIKDPEAKKKAYADLLSTLEREVEGVTGQVEGSKRKVEEWQDSWKITGNQKLFFEMSKTELENDKARLAMFKEQRDAIRDLTSERTLAAEAARKENAENEKSKDYIETLRQEVAYMKASREEQIAMDAAKNTTGGDTAEAEKLLAERDAILAKKEVEAKLEEEKQRAVEEEEKRKEKAAADEAKRIAAITELGRKAHEEKIKQAKQAEAEQAKAHEEFLSQQAKDKEKEDEKRRIENEDTGPIQAVTGRLLARGPGESVQQKTYEEIRAMVNDSRKFARQQRDAEKALQDIMKNKPAFELSEVP